MELDSYTCVTCESIFINTEAFNNHKCEPLKKIGKGEPFCWNHNATLSLLAAYNALQSDKENVRKQKKFWHDLAKELQKLGYNVTADQTRWKFNALLRKYKNCVANNSKSGTSPMAFAYFDKMQDMFSHWKNINCNHVIGSSFIENKRQSSSLESEQQISSVREQISSCTSELLPTKISKMKCQQELFNMASSSNTPRSETSRFATPSFETCSETSSSRKRKKSRAGSATNITNTKLELEKQWLEHLKILDEKSKKEDEKLKKIDQKLQLRKKQLLWKQMIINRKMQKKEERHRERMRIENEKCQLLRQLIETIKQNSFDSINQ